MDRLVWFKIALSAWLLYFHGLQYLHTCGYKIAGYRVPGHAFRQGKSVSDASAFHERSWVYMCALHSLIFMEEKSDLRSSVFAARLAIRKPWQDSCSSCYSGCAWAWTVGVCAVRFGLARAAHVCHGFSLFVCFSLFYFSLSLSLSLSLWPSLTPTLTHSLTHSLTHARTHPATRPFDRLPACPPARTPTHSLTHARTHALTY